MIESGRWISSKSEVEHKSIAMKSPLSEVKDKDIKNKVGVNFW